MPALSLPLSNENVKHSSTMKHIFSIWLSASHGPHFCLTPQGLSCSIKEFPWETRRFWRSAPGFWGSSLSLPSRILPCTPSLFPTGGNCRRRFWCWEQCCICGVGGCRYAGRSRVKELVKKALKYLETMPQPDKRLGGQCLSGLCFKKQVSTSIQKSKRPLTSVTAWILRIESC